MEGDAEASRAVVAGYGAAEVIAAAAVVAANDVTNNIRGRTVKAGRLVASPAVNGHYAGYQGGCQTGAANCKPAAAAAAA